jgi:sodium-independent sulfate anion transporter 11
MEGSTSDKIKKCLLKSLGIKAQIPYPRVSDIVTRGESMFSTQTTESYVEEEPNTAKWLQELVPTSQQVGQYLSNLFPFVRWIGRYNLQWLIGDLGAGQF